MNSIFINNNNYIMADNNSSISRKDERFAAVAAEEAMKSPLYMRVGCAAALNGRIITRGHNNYRTYSKNGVIQNTMSCHAECAVLHNLKKMYNNNSKVVQEGSAICC